MIQSKWILNVKVLTLPPPCILFHLLGLFFVSWLSLLREGNMQQIDLHWHPPYLYRKKKQWSVELKMWFSKYCLEKKAFSIRYSNELVSVAQHWLQTCHNRGIPDWAKWPLPDHCLRHFFILCWTSSTSWGRVSIKYNMSTGLSPHLEIKIENTYKLINNNY